MTYSAKTTCKFFNGTVHERCEAGIEYKSVRSQQPFPNTHPCFSPSLTCIAREYPTDQEIEAEEKRIGRAVEAAIQVEKVIRQLAGDRWGSYGVMECPICGTGTVEYSISSLNGHMSARCDTDGCVNFIQ